MNVKTKFFLVLFLFCGAILFAQDSYVLEGVVVSGEDNLPIPGVNVKIADTQTGASTDFDGNFQITVSNGDILQFSYVGFATQNIVVTGQPTLNVAMALDNTLDEVVVIGYGIQNRKKVTGAVGKVKNEDLNQIAVGTADEALVGQVAGLNISASEGDAGSDSTINIRGVGSISGGSGPLLIVDGIPLDASFLNTVDVNDIESVEVLKDAASASIYGSRAAGGVIIITTKQGKEGKTTFAYNHFTGFKEGRQSEDYDVSVADWHAQELEETGVLSSRSQYRELIGVDESWQDRIFDGGQIESHSFSARGGSAKTKFNTSLSYLHDEGVLLTDDFKRYNFKLKVDTKVNDKFSFGASLAPSYTNRRRFDGSTHDILRQQPWLPTFHTDHTIQFVDRTDPRFVDVQVGDYAWEQHFNNYDLLGDGNEVDLSSTTNANPAAKVLERDRTDKRFRMYGNFYGKYKIASGLNLKATIGGDFQSRKQRRWQGSEANRNGISVASLSLDEFQQIHILAETLLTYDKSFGSHNFNTILGASAEEWDREYIAITAGGFSSDLIQTLTAGTQITENQSYETEERLLSFFGRVNYSYEDKYLASLSARTDGHSSFGANNKYGFFPAVSVGWNIARENFLSESDFISDLKLRGSYGLTGNKDLAIGSGTISDNIELYPSLQLYGPSTGVINNAVVNGFAPINADNPDLKWERSREYNLAIDFGFLNGRITGSVDVYNKTSDQLLLNVPTPTTTGFSAALDNRGEVVNTGIEVELRTRNISSEKIKWNSTILFSKNENELTDFGGASGLISSVDAARPAEWINLEGQTISSFYGFVADYEVPNEFLTEPYRHINLQAQDVYVKDLNGDGVIDDDDKTVLGSPYPDFIWSIANDFQFGNIDFNFTFQGSYGGHVRNITEQYIFNQFNGGAFTQTNIVPNAGFLQQKIFTDDQIQDASYTALRTVTLGYSFDKDIITSLGLSKARVYASGQNLVYITGDGYSGWNPEVDRNAALPLQRGYQRGASPIARTISLGVNLEF